MRRVFSYVLFLFGLFVMATISARTIDMAVIARARSDDNSGRSPPARIASPVRARTPCRGSLDVPARGLTRFIGPTRAADGQIGHRYRPWAKSGNQPREDESYQAGPAGGS